jgi:hypothetical protein
MNIPFPRGGLLAAACACFAVPSYLTAGSISFNFDDGAVPDGSAVFGSTVVEPTGGFAGGALKLVKNVNGLQGSYVINDLDGGAPVNSMNATFKVRAGGGTSPPADGWSFCFGADVPDAAWGEEGIGTGLIATRTTRRVRRRPSRSAGTTPRLQKSGSL